MNAAESVIDAIRRGGADTVFGVPGGGANLELIGAAQAAGLRFVLSHSETAGAITAATYGLLVGRPAMAMATRGPGATAAVNGIAQATLDRYPLVFVTDCVSTVDRDRVAHQRLDQRALMAPITKSTGTIGSGDAATTARAAVELAASWPRGAVHLDYDPSASSELATPTTGTAVAADRDAIDRARELVESASRPVAIVGFEAVDSADAVRAALARLRCPVLTTYQACGLLPDGDPQWAGIYTGGAVERDLLDRADLVITVGLDTVEPIPAPWGTDSPVVALRRVAPASTFVPADVDLVGPLAPMLDELARSSGSGWPDGAGATERAAVSGAFVGQAGATFGPIDLTRAVARSVPSPVTVTVDAGAHFLSIMPLWPVSEPLRLLISNGLATMGFALPAAIGAALARPGEPVVCLVGDGGLGMTLAELETVARLDLPITVVVYDDAALSLIEVKQRAGQGGADAVRYEPIDFAAVAAAMGVDALAAESVAEVERALSGGWNRPRLVDARIDPESYGRLIRLTRG